LRARDIHLGERVCLPGATLGLAGDTDLDAVGRVVVGDRIVGAVTADQEFVVRPQLGG
jgi:hypothetical protein